MVAITGLLSGFAVKDIDAARTFYSEKLGLPLGDGAMGNVTLALPQGGVVLMYPKEDHEPATYTMLNLEVADIDVAVDELASHGVTMIDYGMPHQDAKHIARGKAKGWGPDIAWFTDPSGNILSVLEN
jgi:catechol 2,3-dioxygenase-like lactoylglutathione lyase family enzyme